MKQILFVDDEPGVLDGLRRMLRPMRREWEMHFADGAEAALATMTQVGFDIVVSDLRMPGMNGVELFEALIERHPRTVRIALSGHADVGTALEAARAAHQYLAKPCDPDALKDAVERVCALRDLLEIPSLDAVLGRIESLPSLPSLYVEITEEIRSRHSSLARVGAIIERDVAMTAKMLQIVNSAFFGLRRHVSSPAHAATLLGVEVVRGLVLAAKVFSQWRVNTSGLDLEAMWQHSVRTGALAREIARREAGPGRHADFASMAGMLHDVGRLVLASHFAARYAEMESAAASGSGATLESEREAFGCTHMDVGAYLLGIWGLPSPIVEAVAYHHRPSRCPTSRFGPLTAVHVADALLRAATPRPGAATELDLDHLERVGLVHRIPDWAARARAIMEGDGNGHG